jgi:hypothetical protein
VAPHRSSGGGGTGRGGHGAVRRRAPRPMDGVVPIRPLAGRLPHPAGRQPAPDVGPRSPGMAHGGAARERRAPRVDTLLLRSRGRRRGAGRQPRGRRRLRPPGWNHPGRRARPRPGARGGLQGRRGAAGCDRAVGDPTAAGHHAHSPGDLVRAVAHGAVSGRSGSRHDPTGAALAPGSSYRAYSAGRPHRRGANPAVRSDRRRTRAPGRRGSGRRDGGGAGRDSPSRPRIQPGPPGARQRRPDGGDRGRRGALAAARGRGANRAGPHLRRRGRGRRGSPRRHGDPGELRAGERTPRGTGPGAGAAGTDPVLLWDALEDRPIATLGTGEVRAVSWSPDGNQVVTVGADGRAWLWDVHRVRMERGLSPGRSALP